MNCLYNKASKYEEILVEKLQDNFKLNGYIFREAAKKLAKTHREIDSKIKRVLISNSEEEIRLLEVTGSVETTNEIIPFTFAPQPDNCSNFAVSIILVSEEECNALQAGHLELPEDWGPIEGLEEVPDNDDEEYIFAYAMTLAAAGLKLRGGPYSKCENWVISFVQAMK